MGLLARLYNFVADRDAAIPISSSKVNAEYNQIMNALNGTDTATRIYIRLSDTLPVLRLSQLGGGALLDLLKSGAARVAVAGSGQIQSSLATGTSPLSVASTTVCPNLNANKISGIDPLTEWVSQVLAGQTIKSALTLAKAATGEDIKALLNANVFTLERTSDGADLLTIELIDQATRQIKFPATTEVKIARTPTANTDLARYDEMLPSRTDALFTMWKLAPAANDILGTFIVTQGFGLKFSSLHAAYNTGSPSGTSTITIRRYSGGVGTDLASVSLASTVAKRAVSSSTFAQVTLNKGDIIGAVLTADGGHNSLVVQGRGLR